MEGKSFILVSVPQAQNGSEFARLKQACCQAQNLCIAYKLQLPALRMGTLDALISLCDDLVCDMTFFCFKMSMFIKIVFFKRYFTFFF